MKFLKTFSLLAAVVGLTTISSCKKDEPKVEPNVCISMGANYSTNTSILFNHCSSNVSSYSWNFGDGNSSGLENPTHVYTSAGVYTVKLTGTSVDGVSGSVSKSVTITDKTPKNMIVNSITLTKWPQTDNGSAWDNSSYPDIFATLYAGSNIYWTSSIYYENCAPGSSFVFDSNAGLPITIGNLNNDLNIGYFDWDAATPNDWMGGIVFTPLSKHVSGESSFTITAGEFAMRFNVSWVY